MTPQSEIVKALRDISEGPWESYGPSVTGTTFDHESSVVPTLPDQSGPIAVVSGEDDSKSKINADFIASSPRWLAEMVVRMVEEGAVLCARKQQSSWLWDEWSGPAQKRFIGQALFRFDITPEDFAWLKGKVRG